MRPTFLIILAAVAAPQVMAQGITCVEKTPGNYVCQSGGKGVPARPDAGIGAGVGTGTTGIAPGSTGRPGSNPFGTGPVGTNTRPTTPVAAPTTQSCLGSATRIISWASVTGPSVFQDLRANESLAIAVNMSAFPLAARPNYLMQVVEGGSMSQGADIQFTVSDCPGDFNAGARLGPQCHRHTNALGDSIQFKTWQPGAAETRALTCWLPAGTTTAYFNIRPVMAQNPAIPSCPLGADCKFNFALSR